MTITSPTKPIVYSSRFYQFMIIALAGLLMLLNWRVIKDLFDKWYAQDLTGTYSHGLLVAVIVIYFCIKIIRENPDFFASVRPSIIGLFLLGVSQLGLFLATLASINFVQHLTLLSSLLALVWAVYSFDSAKKFILPALLLSFSFPVWGSLDYPLQKVAIFLTNEVLKIAGVSYYLQGPYFHFSSGIIEIAPECSGLQQLLVSLIIGVIFSMQRNLRIRELVKTLIYFSLAAIILNTIRIVIIMIVGYYTKMETSLVTKHLTLGWVIYGIGIYVFLYFYSKKDFARAAEQTQVALAHTTAGIFKVNVVFLATSLMIILPAMFAIGVFHYLNKKQYAPDHLHPVVSRWHKQSDTLPVNWHPVYPQGNSLVTAHYTDNQSQIFYYENRFVRFRNDIEPVNMGNVAYNQKVWSLKQSTKVYVTDRNGKQDRVDFDFIKSRAQGELGVMSFYIVNGHIETNLVRAKLATLLGMLKLEYDIRVVCIATLVNDESNENVILQLKKFYRDLDIS